MKHPRRAMSINREILLLSCLFFGLILVIFSGVFLSITYRSDMENARNSLQQCNGQIDTYLDGMLHENTTIVRMLADNPMVIQGKDHPEEILEVYRSLQKSNANITYVYSAYADGTLYINDYPTPSQFDASTRPWYSIAAKSVGVASLVYRDAVTNEWMFSKSMRLTDGNGCVVGAVAVDCSNEIISEQLMTKYQFASQRSYLLDSRGTVLLHPQESWINASILDYMGEDIWRKILFGKDPYGEYKLDGVPMIAYFDRVPGTDFFAATAINKSELTEPIVSNLLILVALVAGATVLLGFLLCQILMDRFASPIITLESRIRAVADGRTEMPGMLGRSNREIHGIANSIEVIVKDLARREEDRQTAEYRSLHDALTGAYNRRYFDDAMNRLNGVEQYPLTLLCCDINGLKLMNDVFGHNGGDALIRTVARCLRVVCGKEGVVARMGGDEFSVLLPHCSASHVQSLQQQIRDCMRCERICGVPVSVSLGYAVKTTSDLSTEELVRRADKMMYGEKMRESAAMRQTVLDSILETAQQEGCVEQLSPEEAQLLEKLESALYPNGGNTLLEAYCLRNIGQCSLFRDVAPPVSDAASGAEMSYRVLSVFEKYRSIAGSVLYSAERFDGTGAAKLKGRDIPIASRIISVAAAYFAGGLEEIARHAAWYDPAVVAALHGILAEAN